MKASTSLSDFRRAVAEGVPDELPAAPGDDPNVDHAPPWRAVLSDAEKRQAVSNALRYFPQRLHEQLAPEFARRG